jgi:hypothetical protein
MSFYSKIFGTKSNIALMGAGERMEHILNLHSIGKKPFWVAVYCGVRLNFLWLLLA